MVELTTLGAPIKTTYEGEANTNAFTDAEKTKLAGITSGATAFTAEEAQDAVGSILVDGTTVNFTYNDATPSITAEVQALTNTHIASGAAIDAAKIGDGSVTTTEFQYINTLSSNAQTQINTKVSSIITGITGADVITNMVSLTQAEYDAIGTPSATTFYVITDA